MGQKLTLWSGEQGSVYTEAEARPAGVTGRSWDLCAQITGLQTWCY